jgi:putative membrane protein
MKATPNDYLANERTLLAWVRTSIGVMAFGFVVFKFSLFVKQIALILKKDQVENNQQAEYSETGGVALVVLGLVTLLMAFIQYLRTKKQLDKGEFIQSSISITILIGFIVLIGTLLIAFLIKTG